MSIRVGVDVGGTFTKAVAIDAFTAELIAEEVVPTTHDSTDGVSDGVVEVVRRLVERVGSDRITLVTHSTTQAVNALLEGDVATVGVVGMSAAADARNARKRTVDVKIELAAGRTLRTLPEFLEITGPLDPDEVSDLVARLRLSGAEAIAVAEAFAPDDTTNEAIVAAVAQQLGLPVTTSAELTGLYGLELRAVTAAINASILPIAMRTARVVGDGVTAVGIESPVMVMRGDGGATDLEGFAQAPARTLYSGPAASVAGVLRTARIEDALIVEVGGTSTNVAAVRRGRPALSYVQVASHSTAVRALDVRVLGVAGGSMLRARQGRRRGRVHGVGPRSAHIAGLHYACFLEAPDLEGAIAGLTAPCPGDPNDYVVLRLQDGRRVALTNTCASNALGIVQPGDYASGDRAAALAAFSVAGALLRMPPLLVARQMLTAAVEALGELVSSVMTAHQLERPAVVAVGGGAGGVGRAVATAMGLPVTVPPNAEVISAIGDALSLIRAERERTFGAEDLEAMAALIAEVEGEAIRAGAGPATLDVRVEHVAERGAVRVTATGSVGLTAGAVPGRGSARPEDVERAASDRGYHQVRGVGSFWLATGSLRKDRLALFDRFGDLVLDVRGHVLEPGALEPDRLAAAFEQNTKRIGLVTIPPEVWVVHERRVLQVPAPEAAILYDAARAICSGAAFTVILGRE